MKKTGIILSAALLSLGLLTGCGAAQKAIDDPPPGFTLTALKASEIALDSMGTTKEGVTYTVVNGSESAEDPYYDVEIALDGVVYRYRIDGRNGDIIKLSVNDQPTSPDALPLPQDSPAAAYIGYEEAKRIALADAGVAEEELLSLKYEMDYLLGEYLYEIEFETVGHEYEYEINAKDGSIFRKNVDHNTVKEPAPATSSESYIGVEKAAELALADAALSAEQVIFEKTEWDMKKGTPVYEVEFVAGGIEYAFEIHAVTGAIVSRKPLKNPVVNENTPSEPHISAEQAQAAALAHAGLSQESVRMEKTEVDVEKGRVVYEVEFKAGGYEYEYEIDAGSGEILQADKEYDD